MGPQAHIVGGRKSARLRARRGTSSRKSSQEIQSEHYVRKKARYSRNRSVAEVLLPRLWARIARRARELLLQGRGLRQPGVWLSDARTLRRGRLHRPAHGQHLPTLGCSGLGLLHPYVGFAGDVRKGWHRWRNQRSEEHTSELQSHSDLVCRLLLEKK